MNNKRFQLLSKRREIDSIDTQISRLLVKRLRIVQRIGVEKRQTGDKIKDSDRETTIIYRVSHSIPKDFAPAIKKIFNTILAVSRNIQKQ